VYIFLKNLGVASAFEVCSEQQTKDFNIFLV